MQVLYISGMPGTGKTASVMHTVQQLTSDRSMPKIAPVHINAMRLGSPGAVFAEIYNQLPHPDGSSGGSCAANAAHGELTGFFQARKCSDPVVLLMIDEIDHLITRNQAVLYRVFAWLSLPRPRLVVAAISNTMDLPERLLPRVASRFGIVRVDYAPYRREQIVQILHERLDSHQAMGAFTATTLKLCAARVAAGSGDIRKALQLCCRAVEVRLSKTGARGPADVCHLQVAEAELLRASPAAMAIAGLALRARRLLAALLLELRAREADAVPVQALTTRYAKLLAALQSAEEEMAESAASCAQRQQPPDACAALPGALARPEEEVAYLVHKLEAVALVTQHSQCADLGRTVALGAGLDTDDLAAALETAEGDAGILALVRESRSQRRGGGGGGRIEA